MKTHKPIVTPALSILLLGTLAPAGVLG